MEKVESEVKQNVPWAILATLILTVAVAGGVYYYQFIFVPSTTAPIEPPKERTIELTAEQWQFTPNTIVVNKGDMVTLKIKASLNKDTSFTRHGFIILGVDGTVGVLPKDQVTEIKFVASQPGTFQFLCTIFCGKGHTQMTGTLEVRG